MNILIFSMNQNFVLLFFTVPVKSLLRIQRASSTCLHKYNQALGGLVGGVNHHRAFFFGRKVQ